MRLPLLLALMLSIGATTTSRSQPPSPVKAEPRELLPDIYRQHFAERVAEYSAPSEALEKATPATWPAEQEQMRDELRTMLGLNPWPARGDLKPVITGKVPGDGYTVEKLEFQSSPGLYVTGDLYVPEKVTKPLPTILYVCGHALVLENGVSMGNKAHYQHHGSWFARHGYVCLIIDTIELGEIRGYHHGTFNMDRWWWPARGYTPAGVEAWNGIRALDYLETRPEVDRTRIGVTGRSGGGAYSWYIAALDDRIKVAVPTAGITTLKDYVLDGCIEGHCDCMFMVNSGRWDFDRLAALIAPRPLCIANTDKDPIFPIDGVMEIFNRTRALYKRLGAEEKIGIQIAEGPHADTQPLNTGAFHWFDRFFQGADRMDLTDEPAYTRHKSAELKVFTELPKDEKVTTIDETFVHCVGPLPDSASEPPTNGIQPEKFLPAPTRENWPGQRAKWMQALREECFGAWRPAALSPLSSPSSHLPLTVESFPLRLDFSHADAGFDPAQIDEITLEIADRDSFAKWETKSPRKGLAEAVLYPRGIGETSLAALSEKKQIQILRRFQLLGETMESGQVLDIVQAAARLRTIKGLERVPISLRANERMAVNAIYASLFIPGVKRLILTNPTTTHQYGPIYLDVLRHLDVPQALAMAAENAEVELHTSQPEAWAYPREVAKVLGWDEKRITVTKD